jgi:hypothetical protein
MLGAHEEDLDEPKARAAAELCIAAGADVDHAAQWVERDGAELRCGTHPPVSQPCDMRRPSNSRGQRPGPPCDNLSSVIRRNTGFSTNLSRRFSGRCCRSGGCGC